MIDDLSDDACVEAAQAAFVPDFAESIWDTAAPVAQPGFPMILVGLDTIAKAVGAGNRTILRWIREEGFPARRNTDGIYRADPEAVRRWFATSCLRHRP